VTSCTQLIFVCCLYYLHADKQIEHWPVHKKTCGKSAAELQAQTVEDTDTGSASAGSSQVQTSVVLPLVAPHGIHASMLNKQVGTTPMHDPNKVPRNSHGDHRSVHARPTAIFSKNIISIAVMQVL
jgi:hypothetical protein